MKQKGFSSTADRRWQRRYERIQRRKDEEAIRKDSEISVDQELREYGVDQLEIYRMMLEYDEQRQERERRRREAEEAMQRSYDLWKEDLLRKYWEDLVSNITMRDESHSYGRSFRHVFVDEFTEIGITDIKKTTEELDDLDAGDDKKLSEFLNEFMIGELSEVRIYES